MPDNLRSRMIRTAFTHPELRPTLLPLITKSAKRSDLDWATGEIEKALENLGDVVQVLEARGSGSDYEANTSWADDYSDVSKAVEDIKLFARRMDAHLSKLKRLGR